MYFFGAMWEKASILIISPEIFFSDASTLPMKGPINLPVLLFVPLISVKPDAEPKARYEKVDFRKCLLLFGESIHADSSAIKICGILP
jgi:hypothetical protein